MAKVLIVDDDEIYVGMLTVAVERLGHEVSPTYRLQDGLAQAQLSDYDLVFLDVYLPDGNGLEFIPRFQGSPSMPEVIILTGSGDPDGAEMAIKSGAWAYVPKGGSLNTLILPLTRALQYRREKAEAMKPKVFRREGIIGHSPRIRDCLDLMAKAAATNANVLVHGETGTGKELFARAIHENSRRGQGPFVVVDCAALPETLVESLLFGHVRGAYTGADQTQGGLVAQAHQGTLFLDEVGELPLIVQKSFLRVLQERVFRPVGGQHEIKSDFRLVAATNRNIEQMVEDGRFRADLLFRLSAFVLELPALRECQDDIHDLALNYVAKTCSQNKTGTKGVSPDFLEGLLAYNWPGNVRELINTLDRALVAAQDEPTLYLKHLPAQIRVVVARRALGGQEMVMSPGQAAGLPKSPAKQPTLREYRETMERQYLKDLIENQHSDIETACRISGLSKSRLYDLLKKYGMGRSGYPK